MPWNRSLPLGQALWKAAKGIVAAGILAAVSWAFYQALRDLDRYDYVWQPGWLFLSGAFYLGSVCFSVIFWAWAMRRMGQQPGWLTATRAYLLGTLGKYVPGKALAILLRTALIRGPNVRISIAALTVVYETLIYMAAAAVWATFVFCWRYPAEKARLGPVLRAVEQKVGLPESVLQLWQVLLLVSVAACLPTVPAVYRRLIHGVVRPFQRAEAAPLPALPAAAFPVGLALAGAAWALCGLGLWAAVQAVHDLPFTLQMWLDCTAYLGLATVIGFFTPVPAGLGVRELMLLALLTPELGQGPAALVALLLRLAWMASEIVAAAAVFPLARRVAASQHSDHDLCDHSTLQRSREPPHPPCGAGGDGTQARP